MVKNMGKEPTQYTLDQLNDEIDKGNILESSISGPSQQIRVYCIAPLDLHGGFCGTHLHDLWIEIIDGQKLFKVGCGVCGYEGFRKIGKQGYINGKGI